MANALKALFEDIANAIRGKTGDEGSMKPSEFPEKIEAIETGGGGASTEEIDDILDEINGEVIGETLYYVTFMGIDGVELCRVPVYEGHDCDEPVANKIISKPTKESTRYIDYIFSGWSLTEGGSASSVALSSVKEDRTVYVAFYETYIYLYSGKCGSTASYTVNPDYVLEISGSGATTVWDLESATDYSAPPWYQYRTSITKVIVGDRITRIGSYAFYEFSSATEFVIGQGVTWLMFKCFMGCGAVTTITLPESLTIISGHAFRDCSSLQSINIPPNVYALQQNPFALGCDNLKSVTFERTTGWFVGNDATGEAIMAADLADPAYGAEIAKSYYLYNAEVAPNVS